MYERAIIRKEPLRFTLYGRETNRVYKKNLRIKLDIAKV